MSGWSYEGERESTLATDAMTQGEYLQAAVAQYAAAHGAHAPEREWILSPFDTWERNPYYRGPRTECPES